MFTLSLIFSISFNNKCKEKAMKFCVLWKYVEFIIYNDTSSELNIQTEYKGF